MTVYYNEHDPAAAAWLRELIRRNLIAPGDVDERTIEDVKADELAGYTQCHFFAGIGTWSYALRNAGWPDDRPVWTGSPPCQPFSAAGRRQGYDDSRHLAPAWLDLVAQRRPPVVFGEQVSSAFGKNMQKVRGDEAFLRFLHELLQWEDVSALELQSLSSQLSQSQQRISAGTRKQQAQTGQGDLPLADGEAQSLGEGSGFFNHDGRNTRLAGCGGMQRDRNPVRHGSEAGLGDAITGSDQAWSGIHVGELPPGALLRECDDAGLGRIPDPEDCESDAGAAARALYHLATAHRAEVDGAPANVRHPWLDDLQDALEAEGYATGAVVLPACGVGAPHIRQRGWFVAERVELPESDGQIERRAESGGRRAAGGCGSSGLGNSSGKGLPEQQRKRENLREAQGAEARETSERGGAPVGGMAQPNSDGCESRGEAPSSMGHGDTAESTGGADRHGPTRPPHNHWRTADWLFCRDGKFRPVEPGTFPLAHGAAARVGRLRGYGNGIVAQVAEEVILAYTGDYWLT